MTDTPVLSELEALAPGQISLVGGDTFTVQDVANKLTAPIPAPSEDEPPIPFPPLPKRVELTDDARSALEALPGVFGKVEMEERRVFSAAELELLATEDDVISRVLKLATARREVIREIIRHHKDMVALNSGVAFARPRRLGARIFEATPRDHHGHLLLATSGHPHVTEAPGFSTGWSQSFTSGGTSQSLALLEQLRAADLITRAEYLSFTREVRVLDEDRIKAAIRKNPDRGLRILKKITVRKPPNSSLNGPSRS